MTFNFAIIVWGRNHLAELFIICSHIGNVRGSHCKEDAEQSTRESLPTSRKPFAQTNRQYWPGMPGQKVEQWPSSNEYPPMWVPPKGTGRLVQRRSMQAGISPKPLHWPLDWQKSCAWPWSWKLPLHENEQTWPTFALTHEPDVCKGADANKVGQKKLSFGWKRQEGGRALQVCPCWQCNSREPVKT